MNTKRISSVLLFLFCLSLLKGQVIESESASIILNAENKDEVLKPEIHIVTPSFSEGTMYKTLNPRVELIGKIDNFKVPGSVIVRDEKTEIDKNGTFKIPVWLEPGINEVSIIAFDAKNTRIEKKIEMEYQTPEVTLANKIRNESDYYGLIIAINNYNDREIPQLDSPVPDAEKLKNVLISKYFFDEKNIIFLKDATRDEIVNALGQLRKRLRQNDNLLIFYAGHGYWSENSNVGYWWPSDAQKNIWDKWLSNNTIVDYLKEIQTRHLLLIADACFSGAIFTSRAVNLNRKETKQELYELPSRKAMTSGSRTEVPDPSIFTRNLIEMLDNSQESVFTSEELFNRIKVAVEGNADAVPIYGKIENADDKGGEFIFINNNRIK